ncbi:hypothetical protein, partial [Streptomyces sp. NPDC014656]|uniref:hypothetical protein n=1 Tax=Streptomyces sp. NPDC014656 TaxID=3364878 RepID=UPI0036FA55DF
MTDSFDDGIPDWVRPQRPVQQPAETPQPDEPSGSSEEHVAPSNAADAAGQTSTAEAEDAGQTPPESD